MAGSFRGGVHPHDAKEHTANLPVEDAGLPERFFVPVGQHIGAPAKPVVAKGDEVLRGQVIGESLGFVSAPVHAPTSGVVRGIVDRPHTLGSLQPAIEIEPDGEDKWFDGLEGFDDPFNADPVELRRAIQLAGIVGMGGAGFPTHVKLSPPPEIEIDTVILNGVECEPYLTADHRLMLERPQEVLDGLKVILTIFGLEQGFVGIEKNKPDAIAMMSRTSGANSHARVKPLDVRYPQGAEKQLIKAVAGREVPSGALPMAVGSVVQNVATAAAIWETVTTGRPLTERITTVTGPGVREPKNMSVRVGTPVSHLLEKAGGMVEEAAKLILGGPMMGLSHHTADVSATKTTSGVLVFDQANVRTTPQGPCISCGRCVGACPMGLSPTTIYKLIETEMVGEADEWNALDCIECGSCSFICPSFIPLVQYIRYSKGRVLSHRKATQS